MATIGTAFQIYDGMTGPLKGITRALNVALSSFEAMETASSTAIDTGAIKAARSELAQVEVAIGGMDAAIRANVDGQQRFNDELRDGERAAGGILGKLGQIATVYGAIRAVRWAKNWTEGLLEAADTQRSAEVMLEVVLANKGFARGGVDPQSDAYTRITEAARDLSGKSLYGDELLIGGAAEIATYLDDMDAVIAMMDTYTNYMAGMSGGGELSYQQAVDYATQIGKVLDGQFDGIAKKGFTVSDIQKEIIENGTDMERVAVVADIINQSWAGLADAMAQTPEAQWLQLKNIAGDMREEAGNRLYPAVMAFIDALKENLPQAQSAMMGLAGAVGVIIVVMARVVTVAGRTASFIADNWSMIAPVIGAVVTVMGAWLLITKGVAAAQVVASGIAAAYTTAQTFLSIGFGVLSGNTAAASAAMFTYNSALLACPLTWIVLGLAAVVAAIYVGVAAYNKFTGAAVSATGIVSAAFFTAAAFIYDTFVVPTWNAFAALSNFLFNVFRDPVASVKVLFLDLAMTVVGYIQTMAAAIERVVNKIPGVEVSITGGLDSFYSKLEQARDKVKSDSEWVEVVGQLDYWDLSDAASAGYSFGQGLKDKIGSIFSLDALDAFNMDGLLGGIYDGVGDTAYNTAAMKDSLDISGETLKYMRDIAERKAINRFTTAEITIHQTNENHIGKDADADGIMERWTEDFAERLDVSLEGVHDA